jgi:hypothetical protein
MDRADGSFEILQLGQFLSIGAGLIVWPDFGWGNTFSSDLNGKILPEWRVVDISSRAYQPGRHHDD